MRSESDKRRFLRLAGALTAGGGCPGGSGEEL